MKTKKIKLPKRAKTLSKKIADKNPWMLGSSLAFEIESKWDLIVKCTTQQELSEVIEAWCKRFYLAPYHVAEYILLM